MAQTINERMARYRAKQRATGLVTLSVTVPAEDAKLVTAFASERRRLHGQRSGEGPSPQPWFPLPRPALPAAAQARGTRSDAGNAAPGRPDPMRRAESLADEILVDIQQQGWPTGRPLGSQAELMRKHGVSRSVLRQAIRLLEHQGVARTLRGVGGGLVVDQPNTDAAARAVSVSLEYEGIRATDILHTRRVLELSALALTIKRLDEGGEARLLALIEQERRWDGSATKDDLQRLHHTLADMSGDPALRLFIAIVLRLTEAHSRHSKRPRAERDALVVRITRLHRDIALAVIRRDGPGAATKLSRYLEGLSEWMR
ncbi:MAG TPA: FCD domain-containing protein [Ramlibacter sp.]|nr:FCD domain-containing protein [Ramlibacter sp.]